MLNKLIDAICNALYEEFGDSYTIYTESVVQGLEEPCFMIRNILPTNKHFLNDKYKRTNRICIQYFPNTEAYYTECYGVLERLCNSLEHITIDGNLTRGTDMSGDFTDSTLNFFINYDFFVVKKQEEKERMGEIKTKIELKG